MHTYVSVELACVHHTELMHALLFVDDVVGQKRSGGSLKQSLNETGRQYGIWQKPQEYEINTSKHFYHI